jgi:hypothetical protein
LPREAELIAEAEQEIATGGRGVRSGPSPPRAVPLAGPRSLNQRRTDPDKAPDQRQHDRAGAGRPRHLPPHRTGAAQCAASRGTAGGEFPRYARRLELRQPPRPDQAVSRLLRAHVGGVRLRPAGRYRAGTGGGKGAGGDVSVGAKGRVSGRAASDTLRQPAQPAPQLASQ